MALSPFDVVHREARRKGLVCSPAIVSVYFLLCACIAPGSAASSPAVAEKHDGSTPSSPVIIHTIDATSPGPRFDGLGAISGGGATSRLLVDYPPRQQAEILDLLFKPQFGASLHVLKVEIGGDSQTTDGTESSHMHSRDGPVDCHTGYEWFMLKEARRRNPNVITYALPWSFPGWVQGDANDPSFQDQNPFQHPELTIEYVLEWLRCATQVHNVTLDYLGLWNERSAPGEAEYVKLLRKTLDENGFGGVRLVAKDGNGAEVCRELAADDEYADAVDVVGLHYPSDFGSKPDGSSAWGYQACHNLGKPLWASEESSSYDDANGAMCWANVVPSHFVESGITSSIMWNLVGSYAHGTNWYASSILTADQPWSGWYGRDDYSAPVVWAMAHFTQFARPGWRYLPVGGGSGKLPKGGYFTSLVSPDGGEDFTLVAVKMSRDHASCTRPTLPEYETEAESVTFKFAEGFVPAQAKKKLHLWYSNFELEADEEKGAASSTLFGYLGTVSVNPDGSFTLNMSPGDVFTVSTVDTARKGTFDTDVPASSPKFPLPHRDDFEGYAEGSEARYFADQVGSWEIHPEQRLPQDSESVMSLRSSATSDDSPNMVMRQMTTRDPVDFGHLAVGPVSVIGMREFNDLTVSAKFRLFPPYEQPSRKDHVSACLGVRVDQNWNGGITLCVSAAGYWTLSYGGPLRSGGYGPPPSSGVIATGTANAGPGMASWHELSLTVNGGEASGSLDGTTVLFANTAVRDVDTGFAVIGTNVWAPVEFDDFRLALATTATTRRGGDDEDTNTVSAAERRVERPSFPRKIWAPAGSPLGVAPCARNGEIDPVQNFHLRADWRLLHVASGMCAEVSGGASGLAGGIALAPCRGGASVVEQQFRNDYSRIRHGLVPITLGAYGAPLPETLMTLVGFTNGTAAVVNSTSSSAGPGVRVRSWNDWSVFPNTGQLRNQYVTNVSLGYPMCLTVMSRARNHVAASQS